LLWKYGEAPWRAYFDARTGACREAYSPSLRLRYGRLTRSGPRVLPGSLEIFAEGKAMLSVRLRRMEDHPSWSKDPFQLSVPRGYESRAPDGPL
jgi:hypothetical protein